MASLNKKYINVPKIAVPFTTINNRAKINDLSNDLSVKFGVKRFSTQSIFRLSDETGPSGESVYGVPGDDNIRFVGSWESSNDTNGATVKTGLNITDYAEITFYGTGLNIGLLLSGSLIGMVASIDGGVESAELLTAYSTVLAGRNYRTNQHINVATALPLGLHTIKIRTNNAGNFLRFSGYEVLNENPQLQINSGESQINDAIINTLTSNNLSYNSGFESGVLGVRGGRVAVYQKIDGVIAHTVNPVGVQKNLTLADHSNEEVARIYNFREFGAGRADDFSTLTGAASNRAFTLEDGSTTLVGSVVKTLNDTLVPDALNAFVVFTVFCSGLDIELGSRDGGTPTDAGSIFIDGALVGAVPTTNNENRVLKVFSGSNMGSHVIKINRDAFAIGFISIKNFIVYQPKTPSIPTNAQLIGTTNVLADYVANTATTIESISKGVIRKAGAREVIYKGNWVSGTLPIYINGLELYTSTDNDELIANFFGIGFDYKAYAGNNASAFLYIDGVLATSANLPGITVSVLNGHTYNATTGLISQGSLITQASGFSVTGLTLGRHEVKLIRYVGTGLWYFNTIDIITPLHSYVQAKNNIQNTLGVGNNSLGDERKFSELENIVKVPNVVTAVGVSLNPTTTSTVLVPVPDMMCVINIKSSGRVSINSELSISGASTVIFFQIYLDGVPVGKLQGASNGVNNTKNVALSWSTNISIGIHTVQLMWFSTNGTALAYSTSRVLTVEEL